MTFSSESVTFTRELIEASGVFALQLPTRVMVTLTVGVGSDSGRDVPDKLARHRVQIFTAPGSDLPLVEGCVGWLACRLICENSSFFDLFPLSDGHLLLLVLSISTGLHELDQWISRTE